MSDISLPKDNYGNSDCSKPGSVAHGSQDSTQGILLYVISAKPVVDTSAQHVINKQDEGSVFKCTWFDLSQMLLDFKCWLFDICQLVLLATKIILISWVKFFHHKHNDKLMLSQLYRMFIVTQCLTSAVVH